MYKLNLLTQDLFDHMQTDIVEFRSTFGLVVDGKICNDDDELHTSLFCEELHELSEADNDVDRMDAIVDTAYVLMGRVVHFIGAGKVPLDTITMLPDLYVIEALLHVVEKHGFAFKPSWDAVHGSNMSKVCINTEEVDRTRAKYMKEGITTSVSKVGKYYVVKCYRDGSGKGVKPGKVLKSVEYIPVNLTEVMYG